MLTDSAQDRNRKIRWIRIASSIQTSRASLAGFGRSEAATGGLLARSPLLFPHAPHKDLRHRRVPELVGQRSLVAVVEEHEVAGGAELDRPAIEKP